MTVSLNSGWLAGARSCCVCVVMGMFSLIKTLAAMVGVWGYKVCSGR